MLVSNGKKLRNIGEAQLKEYKEKGYSPVDAEGQPKAPAKKGGK